MKSSRNQTSGKKLPIDYMPNISNVASDTECTGIVPVQPQSEEELDSYLDLYSTSLPPVWDDEEETSTKRQRGYAFCQTHSPHFVRWDAPSDKAEPQNRSPCRSSGIHCAHRTGRRCRSPRSATGWLFYPWTDRWTQPDPTAGPRLPVSGAGDLHSRRGWPHALIGPRSKSISRMPAGSESDMTISTAVGSNLLCFRAAIKKAGPSKCSMVPWLLSQPLPAVVQVALPLRVRSQGRNQNRLGMGARSFISGAPRLGRVEAASTSPVR